MSPMLSITSAIGIFYFVKLNKYLFYFVIGAYLLFFINYYYGFISKYNDLSKSAWQYEYKEIFEKQNEGCISDKYAQPYIFGLFYGVGDEQSSYNKVDPNYFISTRVLNPVNDWGFSTVKSFGNYNFEKICGETN